MTSPKLHLVLPVAALLAACGGGGGGSEEPAAANTVPQAATASPEAYARYAGSMPASDSAEPIDLAGVVPPTSESSEPIEAR